MNSLRIATRKSPLALWQAHHVATRLEEVHPGLRCELVGLATAGDKFLSAPLSTIGGKGLFIQELEQAMLDDRADIAVHSVKDLTVELPSRFVLGAILERTNPFDALVGTYPTLISLPPGAVVGSSSLRRACQIRALRPDINVLPVRGSVGTRLRKLDEGEFDALVLACAGLERLDLRDRIRQSLPPEMMLPAIGQGALGVECRGDDTRCLQYLAPLNHLNTQHCVRAERSLNQALAGGCHAPVAGLATLEGETLSLRALVGKPDGSQILQANARGPCENWESIGAGVAHQLIRQGAASLLGALTL